MLHAFLSSNRAELIERCHTKVAHRSAPESTEAGFEHGIPLFIDQLIRTLRLEQTSGALLGRSVFGPAAACDPVLSEISGSAALHGRELLQHGFTVEQVVRDYGDLCQAVTELAFEYGLPIEIDEFRTLNRCLDDAIAGAVTEYSYGKNVVIAEQGMLALNERLGFLAHELRNHIHTASLALTAIKSGRVGLTGATGAVLERCLIELRSLVDRSLADVRVTAGLPGRHKLISMIDFIGEIKASASLEARSRDCTFTVSDIDPFLAVEVDWDLLSAAVGNLLQNAFKFTRHRSEVSLTVHAVADRVLIDVKDTCGGLPPGEHEQLFQTFAQNHADRSGLGLGLSISRRSVEANNGTLRVQDLPGIGCIFTIDLPRHTLPLSPAESRLTLV